MDFFVYKFVVCERLFACVFSFVDLKYVNNIFIMS